MICGALVIINGVRGICGKLLTGPKTYQPNCCWICSIHGCRQTAVRHRREVKK